MAACVRTGWPPNMGCFFMLSMNDSTSTGASNVQQLRLQSMLWDGLVKNNSGDVNGSYGCGPYINTHTHTHTYIHICADT